MLVERPVAVRKRGCGASNPFIRRSSSQFLLFARSVVRQRPTFFESTSRHSGVQRWRISSRFGPKEFRHALDMARGSLAEVSYGLVAAKELGYLKEADWASLEAIRDEASRVLWALLKAVSARCPPK